MKIKYVFFRVSYVEIYNENLIDLLNLKKNIKITETYHSGVKVDATERMTTTPEEVLEIMREVKNMFTYKFIFLSRLKKKKFKNLNLRGVNNLTF